MTDDLETALTRAVGAYPRHHGPRPDPVTPHAGAITDDPPALNSTALENTLARAVGAPTKENR